jgi:MFS family permease
MIPASIAIFTTEFPTERETLISYLEMCEGLGMCLGPLMCGLIFQWFNYGGTIAAFSLLLALATVYIYYKMPERMNHSRQHAADLLYISATPSHHRLSEEELDDMPPKLVENDYPYSFFFVNADILALLLILLFTNIGLFAYENGLSVYLTDTIGMNENYISYIFALRAFTYALFCKLSPLFLKFFTNRQMIGSGIFLAAVANAFTGGAYWLGLTENYFSVMIGMLLNGICSASIFCVFVPELLYIASLKIGCENDERMNDMMSGMYFSVYNIGYFLSPIISGLLTDAKSY